METLQIKIPEGYEVDTFDIKTGLVTFKKKTIERWIDNLNNEVVGYIITDRGGTTWCRTYLMHAGYERVFSTKEQAQSALAKAQLGQIIKNDPRFGGPITNEEWKDTSTTKFVIMRKGDEILTDSWLIHYHFLAFHTTKQRDDFLKENEALIRQYFELE